jgi:hypothetical protein
VYRQGTAPGRGREDGTPERTSKRGGRKDDGKTWEDDAFGRCREGFEDGKVYHRIPRPLDRGQFI